MEIVIKVLVNKLNENKISIEIHNNVMHVSFNVNVYEDVYIELEKFNHKFIINDKLNKIIIAYKNSPKKLRKDVLFKNKVNEIFKGVIANEEKEIHKEDVERFKRMLLNHVAIHGCAPDFSNNKVTEKKINYVKNLFNINNESATRIIKII